MYPRLGMSAIAICIHPLILLKKHLWPSGRRRKAHNLEIIISNTSSNLVRCTQNLATQKMTRSQKNDNFIDKTFTVIAHIVLVVLPTSKREKEAFTYYRDGMSAQSEGEYAEALQNYYEAIRFESDPYDRSFIYYNIGLIHTSNGQHTKALEYFYQAIDLNPCLPQAFNNIAVIYHHCGERAIELGNIGGSQVLFLKAAEFWREAIRMAPNNYIEAQNWLQGRKN